MKRVCVFCGSQEGLRPVYREAAVRLGEALLSRGLGLVYGGTHRGLMGTLADTVLAGAGEVVGVIPDGMMSREIAHLGLTRLHVVPSMHERKALMMDLADGFVALPGGYGTLDEISEAVTWAQLRLHRKPCGLLNVEGFFNPLLGYLDHAAAEGFLRPQHRALILEDRDPGSLIDRLARPHNGRGG